MCGVFGAISEYPIDKKKLKIIAMHSRQRGLDSSGIVTCINNVYKIQRADYDLKKLITNSSWIGSNLVLGHSRQATNGANDNQPVVREGLFVIHNGIIVNEKEIWDKLTLQRLFHIDTEAIIGIAIEHFNEGRDLESLAKEVLLKCEGTISAALGVPRLGKLLLFSNNGSLYIGNNKGSAYFASEKYPLELIDCCEIQQIWQDGIILDIPKTEIIEVIDVQSRDRSSLIPVFKNVTAEESLLQYPQPNLRRCTKCILPETMPYISFDDKGVCNYCRNYKLRNVPKPKEELFELVKPYRRINESDCIVSLSGGRDSCYSLHLVVNELKMRPITYTYDWGMVTDLGRRNISRICSQLNVENIIISADISKKRQYIRKNLNAWLKHPHLGMISILTAGDKHFFKYMEVVKKQTGVNLNLWGANPLEVTHFKAGFLGIKPSFEEKKVYMSGLKNQIRYHSQRFMAMLQSPTYFNSSLWDTLSGEYYRSIMKKKDIFDIFDYWTWDEKVINDTLCLYEWELAPDTNTTWRIGDGTAAFYNYIYYTIAGFTEHDTFRSNQIREGQLTREEALRLVKVENQPRYQNIRWYLDTLSMDFSEVINVINGNPKLYQEYL